MCLLTQTNWSPQATIAFPLPNFFFFQMATLCRDAATQFSLVASVGGVTVESIVKTLPAKAKISGLTLIEVLVVIVVIAVLAAMLLPPPSGKRRAQRITCMFNLKQTGESFRMWSLDHNDRLPMQITTSKGGTMELVQSGSAAVHFLALTNSGLALVHRDIDAYIKDGKNFQKINSYTNYGVEVRWLICPSDEPRCRWNWPKSISAVGDTNISYFVGIDATLGNPRSILAGDRNLQMDNVPVKPGLLILTKTSSISWANGLHFSNSISGSGGNILFVDGYGEFLKPKALNASIQSEGLVTNRIAIP